MQRMRRYDDDTQHTCDDVVTQHTLAMPVTSCVLSSPVVRARHAPCARRTCVASAARADGQAPATLAPSTAVLSGRRGVSLCSLAVLAATTVQSQQPALAAAPPAPGVGDAAPAFSLPSTKGGDLSLSGLLSSGKYLVLYYYNADGTTGCSLEAQRFQQALPALEAAGAQLVGVSMDDLSKHTEFCSDKKLTFPLLSDKSGDVSASYGAGACLGTLWDLSCRMLTISRRLLADLKIPILGRCAFIPRPRDPPCAH